MDFFGDQYISTKSNDKVQIKPTFNLDSSQKQKQETKILIKPQPTSLVLLSPIDELIMDCKKQNSKNVIANTNDDLLNLIFTKSCIENQRQNILNSNSLDDLFDKPITSRILSNDDEIFNFLN